MVEPEASIEGGGVAAPGLSETADTCSVVALTPMSDTCSAWSSPAPSSASPLSAVSHCRRGVGQQQRSLANYHQQPSGDAPSNSSSSSSKSGKKEKKPKKSKRQATRRFIWAKRSPEQRKTDLDFFQLHLRRAVEAKGIMQGAPSSRLDAVYDDLKRAQDPGGFRQILGELDEKDWDKLKRDLFDWKRGTDDEVVDGMQTWRKSYRDTRSQQKGRERKRKTTRSNKSTRKANNEKGASGQAGPSSTRHAPPEDQAAAVPLESHPQEPRGQPKRPMLDHRPPPPTAPQLEEKEQERDWQQHPCPLRQQEVNWQPRQNHYALPAQLQQQQAPFCPPSSAGLLPFSQQPSMSPGPCSPERLSGGSSPGSPSLEQLWQWHEKTNEESAFSCGDDCLVTYDTLHTTSTAGEQRSPTASLPRLIVPPTTSSTAGEQRSPITASVAPPEPAAARSFESECVNCHVAWSTGPWLCGDEQPACAFEPLPTANGRLPGDDFEPLLAADDDELPSKRARNGMQE